MQQEKSTTELFDELSQLDNIDFFIESLIELLEIKTIIVRIPDSVSASEINSLGNKLPVAGLIFPINMDALFAYATKIEQKCKSIIQFEIQNISKLIDQLQFLYALEQKLKLAIQKFDEHNPISFMNDLAFKPINDRNDILVEYRSSFELEFTEQHYSQISSELAYRHNLLAALYYFVNRKLNDAQFDEMRKQKFNWKSNDARLELTEIGFAITCMWQFDSQDARTESDFVKKFLNLFGLPGDTVVKDRSTLLIRSNETRLAKDFYNALRTQHKLEHTTDTKKK